MVPPFSGQSTEARLPDARRYTMKALSQELVFLSARRTAFGAFGGALKDQSATDLGVRHRSPAVRQLTASAQPVHRRATAPPERA